MRVQFRLNSEPTEVDVDPTAFMADVVRDLGLTGTKVGCGVGVCGACTMLVDDEPVSGCLHLAGFVDGADVWTIEGLAQRFPQVVEGFVACEGMQCGICTPGQIAAVCALTLHQPDADEDDVRDFLNGNLCRCTGYGTIVEAALHALGGGERA